MIMKALFIIFLLLQCLLAIYLLLPMGLLMVHYLKKWLVGNRSPLNKAPRIQKDFHFAAIITAHKDTTLIPPLVDSILKQTYPNVTSYVVADDCETDNLLYNDKRVVVLRPEPALHAKIKSISHAIDHFTAAHDALVIFDSDNLVHPRYFEYLNKYFQQGYLAVQTHMLSKNTDTVYARLDSIGHIYYTFLDRQARMEIGLSACTLGLGIAIDMGVYREILYKDNRGGFDKKLQADIVMSIPMLAFAKEAIVYDEKVDDGVALETQRTRWLFTYFQYFKVNWNILATGIRKLNANLIYFGYIMLRPPLFILLGSAFLFVVINYFIDPLLSFAWIATICLFALGFVLIIITQSRQKGMAGALLYIPLMILRQIRAMLKIKKAGKGYLKTEHSKVINIEDLLKDEPV
jgi:cellulose synthase/poly-beta-1,6-N-acetylglucosamine synthase-like glycosyltransferase